jgi:signal transduction histidine kinase
VLTVERRSVLALDASVPLVVGAVIVAAGVLHGGSGAQPLTLAVGLAAAAVLIARRRAPGWTLAISGVLVQILFHLDAEVGSIAVLAPAVALYSLALTRGRLAQLLAAIAAIAAVIVADVLHAGRVSVVQTLGHVALVAIPLLLAETLRTRRTYVSLLLERLALAERTREQEGQRRAEQERMRIARDLHDVVAHTLTTINVQAAIAAQLLDRNPEHARAALETIEDASRDAIAELRSILGVLRDADDADAPRAPAPGVENVAELVQRARDAGLDIRLEVTGTRPDRLSDTVSLATYRIVQESLTNAHRHAAGSTVVVRLSFEPGGLIVAVENGAGAAGNGNGSAPGVGIAGMTERAVAVGGTFRAAPLPSGFRVDADLPYTPGGA